MGTAHALARCGFGEELVDAFDNPSGGPFGGKLNRWRDALRSELRTNSRNRLPRKQVKLADGIPNAFPNLDVLRAYVHPVTSESEALSAGSSPLPVPQIRWKHEHNLTALAKFCEDRFEWGTMRIIPKRFRSLLWRGSVVHTLRRVALDIDCREGASTSLVGSKKPPVKGPDSGVALDTYGNQDFMSANANDKPPLISNILARTTAHPQTDFLLEYRVELDPYQLVRLTQSGIEGVREEPADPSDDSAESRGDGDGPRNQRHKLQDANPFSPLRIWVPASMLRPAAEELVDVYEAKREAGGTKAHKTMPKGKRPMTDLGSVVGTTSIPAGRSRLNPLEGSSASPGVQGKKMPNILSNNNMGGLGGSDNSDAFSGASDSDASGGPTTSKRPVAANLSKMSTHYREVWHEVATDRQTVGMPVPFITSPRHGSSRLSRPTQTKAVRFPTGNTSAQRGHLSQDRSKTPHPSLLKVLDAAGWGPTFSPTAMPLNLPSSPTHKDRSHQRLEVGSAITPSSACKRQLEQAFSDTGEDLAQARSNGYPGPRSLHQSNPDVGSLQTAKIAKTTRRQTPVLSLPSTSDSEDFDHVLGPSICSGSQQAESPVPPQDEAEDVICELRDEVGDEIIDLSSEGGNKGVVPVHGTPLQASTHDLAGVPIPKGGSTSMIRQQPCLPSHTVKVVPTKKTATKTHLTKDTCPQPNTLMANVIDLTTP